MKKTIVFLILFSNSALAQTDSVTCTVRDEAVFYVVDYPVTVSKGSARETTVIPLEKFGFREKLKVSVYVSDQKPRLLMDPPIGEYGYEATIYKVATAADGTGTEESIVGSVGGFSSSIEKGFGSTSSMMINDEIETLSIRCKPKL